MKKKIVENQPLIEALEIVLTGSSKNHLREVLKWGRVTVNGLIQRDGKKILSPGDELQVWPKSIPLKDDVQLLFEDANLLVVNKPAGLLSVAANYEEAATVHTYLKKFCKPSRVFVVHRLDREVSGVMIFTKTETALLKLKEALQMRQIKRHYFAVVEGVVTESQGKWESYLEEDENYFVKSTKTPNRGEHAVTFFQATHHFKKSTCLNIQLETGRKNQIRVHCSENGHPIIGDEKYGAKSNPIGRLALHAYKLEFSHPIDGRPMIFETPLPEEFSRLLTP